MNTRFGERSIESFKRALDPRSQEILSVAIQKIVETKKHGER